MESMCARAVAVWIGLTVLAAGAAPAQRPFAADGTRPPRGAGGAPGARAGPVQFLKAAVPADAGARDAPLLFCVGLHIEPLGAEVSALVPGRGERPAGPRPGPDLAAPAGPGGRPRPNYLNPDVLRLHTESIRRLAATVRRHGGVLTVQAQTPFTRLCAGSGGSVLSELQAAGHEIALHFHEQAHLGQNCERLPASVWTAVMKEEIGLLRQACPAARVRYWSGGNNYPPLLEAAAAAGLDVMSDHKDPRRQKTFPELLALQPWRPAGGPGEGDIAAFARHDPRGRIVYLPDGIFADEDFRARKQEGDAAYLDAMTAGLVLSLRAARADRVNVFHVTVHPMEIPDPLLDQWLGRVIEPLAQSGRLKWATFSQMAEAYRGWEQKNPGADPRGRAAAAPAANAVPAAAPAAATPAGYMSFAVNVHDFTRIDESADTLQRLLDIFHRHGAKADFYFTGPYVQVCAEKRPEILRAIRAAGMGIGYHTRPPHPAQGGYGAPLQGLDEAGVTAALQQWETTAMDLASARLVDGRPGGYALVRDTFGAPPVCVSPIAGAPRLRMAMLRILRGMGAKMVVQYHEAGTDPERPFEWIEGLLARPSDFSITRWPGGGEQEATFWWNRQSGPQADPAGFDPVAKLKAELAAWKGARPPFVTALMHDNDFKFSGGPGWQNIYAGPDRAPKSPPYDLNAPDPARPRPPRDREAILKAYEALVEYAAAHLRIVTASEIVAMAEAQRAK